ncbi:MAG: hypothetical protein P0107_03120 [Nitrosomonas sp.]|nr:hypothetical protein [Nitrosomonas sp.]
MFAAAGLLLWSACLGMGSHHIGRTARSAAGIIAAADDNAHGLPRCPHYVGTTYAIATHGFTGFGMTLSSLADQQLGGIVMSHWGMQLSVRWSCATLPVAAQ